MKSERTKREGFSIQDSVSRIILILDPSTKIANRILGNPGKNYQDLAG